MIVKRLHRSHGQRMGLSAETAQADAWQRCCEEQGRPGPAREVLRPLTDDLIRRCLAMGPWEFNGKPVWHRVLDFAMDAGARACPPLIVAPSWNVRACQQCFGSGSARGLTRLYIQRYPPTSQDRLQSAILGCHGCFEAQSLAQNGFFKGCLLGASVCCRVTRR